MINFIITPIVGGVIGYITNWIAIKMLFKPHTEKRLFNIKIPFTPGLIPKERYKLANKVGNTIGQHLLTTDVIIKTLTADKFKGDIEKLLDGTYLNLRNNNYTINQILKHFLSNDDKDKVISDVLNFVYKNITNVFKNEIISRALQDKLNKILINKSDVITQKILSQKDKTIAEVLPYALQNGIKTFFSDNLNNIINIFLQLLDSDNVNMLLKQSVTKMVKNGLGSFASVFVNSDKIYENIIKSIKEYCSDEQNYPVITKQFNLFFDFVMKKSFNEALKALEKELTEDKIQFLILDNVPKIINEMDLIENLNNVIIKLIEDNKDKLLNKFLNIEIGTVKIDELMYNKIKCNLLLKYEGIIKNTAPYIINALNIPQIVEDRINDFEVQQAEEIIISVVKKELNAITWFGALLGFIIGLIPVFIN